jgi:hypothetical protein
MARHAAAVGQDAENDVPSGQLSGSSRHPPHFAVATHDSRHRAAQVEKGTWLACRRQHDLAVERACHRVAGYRSWE